VVLTRDEAIPVLARVTVAVITSSVRGHPAEVPLGSEHGLDHDSVANCDDIVTIGKALLSRCRGSLNVSDIVRLDKALCVALGIELAWGPPTAQPIVGSPRRLGVTWAVG